MSDLISRSKAVQRLIQETVDSKNNLIHINTVKRLLQDVDTAYDIDKTVEKLNKAKIILANEYYCKTINDKKECENSNCFECCADYLIEIVKQGGVADDVCEWNLDGVYIFSPHSKMFSCVIDDKHRYTYCPYCGKKIKVVE